MSYHSATIIRQPIEVLMDEIEIWPGRGQGNEGEWRQAIRDWDEKFHLWMQGKIDDNTAWWAHEDFDAILQDHYLENEQTAKPEFPLYGTKNLREEEGYCSCRGKFMRKAIKWIDAGEGIDADDLMTFRRAMYHRAIRNYWDSNTLFGKFVDVDYSLPSLPTLQVSLG